MNLSNFYDNYHKKNHDTQQKVISRRNYTYQYLIPLIDEHFANTQRGSVLDVGCGVGTVDLYLSNKGFSVLGVDISARAIRLADKSKKELGLSNLHFKVGNVADLNNKSKYDYAICSEVIEHVKDDGKLVSDLYRLLKQGGVLILSTPSKKAPLYRWGLLDDFDNSVGHLRRYSTESLKTLLKEAGFEIVEVRRTEGLLRNFLFTHDQFGFILKFFKWPFTIPVNFIDAILLKIFGESNIYVVAKK